MKELSLVNEDLLRQRLTELGSIASCAPHILSGLERFIRTAGDYDLFRVNPIQYATANGLGQAEGIELFVHAAKVGLFEMQWLLICAYCPQVAGSFRELDQVHPRFQCEFCNALNDAALDDYIQVTFTISSAVRDIVFRHPEMPSVEDYYLRYNFSKDFKPPHNIRAIPPRPSTKPAQISSKHGPCFCRNVAKPIFRRGAIREIGPNGNMRSGMLASGWSRQATDRDRPRAKGQRASKL